MRPFIDERACAWPFTDAAIEISPAARGVYLLYASGRLIYIGAALKGAGIREELRRHRSGGYGSCTRTATSFLYEVAEDAVALHRRYLRAHIEQYGGRLPPCNTEIHHERG